MTYRTKEWGLVMLQTWIDQTINKANKDNPDFIPLTAKEVIRCMDENTENWGRHIRCGWWEKYKDGFSTQSLWEYYSAVTGEPIPDEINEDDDVYFSCSC
jgi:hypothetical protein